MNDLISLIVPVYNVESYISECLESVLKQDHQNFEVIMVDDGSTDKSGTICDQFAKRDQRFVVIHTDNKGIGAARNLAMDRMRGSYCFFLDPDDVLERFSLSYLLELLIKNNADIALGVSRNFSGKFKNITQDKPIETVYSDHKEICEKVIFDKNDLKPLERKKEPSIVNYEFFSSLYKTSIIRDRQIRFLPISYGEDTYVCFKYLLLSSVVVTSSLVTYWHRRNPTSTTFRYHENYLGETKEYYRYYYDLFATNEPEYLKRAEIGLDAQYFRRCVSAIEREIFMSPKDRTSKEMIHTISEIKNDAKFKQEFNFKNIKYVSTGKMRMLLYGVKFGLYPCFIPLVKKQRKK